MNKTKISKQPLKINLGCGKDIKKGYINVDKIKHKEVDLVHDLDNYPYPFKSNSVDEILIFHILEHVKDYEKTLDELKRILKVDGILHIKVPHFSTPASHSEFHKRFFWWNSLTAERVLGDTTSLESHEYKDFTTIYKKLNFQKGIFFWNHLVEPIMNLKFMPQIFEHSFLYALFPAKEIEIKMKKRKSCI